MINLKYDTILAEKKYNETRHPLVVIKELGITYTVAIPQSVVGQWWFYECDIISDNLPEYIKNLTKINEMLFDRRK